jgi:hypothetical protein
MGLYASTYHTTINIWTNLPLAVKNLTGTERVKKALFQSNSCQMCHKLLHQIYQLLFPKKLELKKQNKNDATNEETYIRVT